MHRLTGSPAGGPNDLGLENEKAHGRPESAAAFLYACLFICIGWVDKVGYPKVGQNIANILKYTEYI